MLTLVLWQLHPVPTIQNESKSHPSLLRTLCGSFRRAAPFVERLQN